MRGLIGVGLCLLMILVGCSSKTMVESDLGIDGAPDWVNEGTQILNDKGGRYFHGVGQAPAMGDDSLQISTADNRARAELARIISTYIEVAHRDYGAASGANGNVASQQTISRNIESLSKVNISGSEIIGHWRDEETGNVYSIAELDLEQVKKIIAASQEMNGDFSRYLDTQGENIFDQQMEEMK